MFLVSVSVTVNPAGAFNAFGSSPLLVGDEQEIMDKDKKSVKERISSRSILRAVRNTIRRNLRN